MSIIRSPRRDRGFISISNSVAQDMRLSARALGVLVRLLSRPDNWETNSTTLAKEFDMGREQMQGILRELSSFGYMELVKHRKADGTFLTRWHVYDEPKTGEPEHEEPAPENPYHGEPIRNKHNLVNKEPINTPIAPKGASPAKQKDSSISLPTWLKAIKEKGEKAIPDDDPVREYANQVGLSEDLMRLAWFEFRQRHSEPNAKRYKDWRSVFRKTIRGNWMKLWYMTDDGGYALTTAGRQAQAALEAMAA